MLSMWRSYLQIRTVQQQSGDSLHITVGSCTVQSCPPHSEDRIHLLPQPHPRQDLLLPVLLHSLHEILGLNTTKIHLTKFITLKF